MSIIVLVGADQFLAPADCLVGCAVTLLLPASIIEMRKNPVRNARKAVPVNRTGEAPIEDADDYGTDDNLAKVSEFAPNDISTIDGMEGHEFEYFCADLLCKNGYSDVKVTPGSGDRGVDILAEKGGVRRKICNSMQKYASSLSNTPVQEVNAGKVFYRCHVGVVMTNFTFSVGAKTLAQATIVFKLASGLIALMALAV